MLELKFAIYHRAASLPSQASYTVLAENHRLSSNPLCTPTVFLIQQSFCAKTIVKESRKFELARLKKKKKKKKKENILAVR